MLKLKPGTHSKRSDNHEALPSALHPPDLLILDLQNLFPLYPLHQLLVAALLSVQLVGGTHLGVPQLPKNRDRDAVSFSSAYSSVTREAASTGQIIATRRPT